MGKRGLSGLVRSLARELQPQYIHVAQVVIDGGINTPARDAERLNARGADGFLDPDAIAQTYFTCTASTAARGRLTSSCGPGRRNFSPVIRADSISV